MKTKTRPLNAPDVQFTMPIQEVLTMFINSRIAMGVTKETIKSYMYCLGRFVGYCESQGKYGLSDITPELVRQFLSTFYEQGKSDRYVNLYARQIKTILRFCETEDMIDKAPRISMPKIRRKQLRVLTVAEVETLLDACTNMRDKILILLAFDCGLRREEIVSLRWQDLNLTTGKIEVIEGKGKKYRTVAIGRSALKALMKYRFAQQKANDGLVDDTATIFQTRYGEKITGLGLRSIFERLSTRTGIPFSAHALRRTFAKFSLINGMDITVIQQQMGHASVETTREYVQQLDDTFIMENHAEHGVVDHLIKPNKRRV